MSLNAPQLGQKRTVLEEIHNLLGFDWKAPKGATANLRESAKIFGDARKAFGWVLSLGQTTKTER